MGNKPQNEKYTTLINKQWFIERKKCNIFAQVNSEKCLEKLHNSAQKANNLSAKKFISQIKQKKLVFQHNQDIYEFLGLVTYRGAKTVEKWFYDVDQASWLGVDEESVDIILEVFLMEEELFFKGYDYKRFLNILLTSGNLKFFPVEKAAVSIMMRKPFKYWQIENTVQNGHVPETGKTISIMEEARKGDPRFNVTRKLRERIDAHTKGSPSNVTGLCLYEKNGKGEYRLILKNLVQYLEQAP